MTFNDPWDCKPSFNSDSLADPAVLDRIMRWFHRQAENPLAPEAKLQLETGLREDPTKRLEFIRGLSSAHEREISKRRVYCITSNPTSMLMWSHYADHHKGICLEFGVDNPLFAKAAEVIYCEKYPVWSPDEFEKQQDRATEMVLVKADAWRYEDEFQLISLADGPASHPLLIENDCLSLPAGALKSVIVGCQGDYGGIKAIVDSLTPNLPVRRATRLQNHYRIEIDGA